MKAMSSTDAKTHFGALLDMAQREPVTIHKKDRAVAVLLSRRTWGKAQAAQYASQLQQCLTMLAARPHAGRERAELHPPRPAQLCAG